MPGSDASRESECMLFNVEVDFTGVGDRKGSSVLNVEFRVEDRDGPNDCAIGPHPSFFGAVSGRFCPRLEVFRITGIGRELPALLIASFSAS